MPPDRRDLELIARANARDLSAFEELFRRYRDWVLHMAMRHLGDIDEANDVVQDTFMHLLGRFPGFELTASLAAFLLPLVQGLCSRRRSRGQRMVELDDETAEQAPPARQETAADAASLLAHLSAEQRELLTLRFADDLSLPQLAEMLDTPIGTVKSRLSRAIAALREKAQAPQRSRA